MVDTIPRHPSHTGTCLSLMGTNTCTSVSSLTPGLDEAMETTRRHEYIMPMIPPTDITGSIFHFMKIELASR